ncbi:hypothetical protein J3B02_000833 [Coemansia erecta]|uniref:Peptidase C51 domain-containing protein n=1 Tax=Coemansia asiatica TaxID=1052880 RepID=A0A9W7XLI9_9FUNG|nr:hypothetical protein LPJ64_002520 [Coemansia asiatica]KAJ2857668.1 hypothetical protein J3B02_000833 [Coemansia erecta]KAJ2866828.1 hypothetical protein FB639_004994 [Coemansia asiatica]
MKFFAIVALCIVGLVSPSSAYKIYKADEVNCRSTPSTSGKVVRVYTPKDEISLVCQISGETIFKNALWGKTTDGCYIADYYLKTGSDGYVVGKCKTANKIKSNKKAGPIKDDYPYKEKCDSVDKWNYYTCQCTSFVAWRINSRLKIKFHNMYKGPNWGNANTWDNAARKTGVTVDDKPVPGCVAQSNAGKYGHVAWVAAVSGNNVIIEEYNWVKNKYSVRTVPKSTFNYIHVKH